MNKKDIALTVGGVLATGVLTYLLYRLQQRDAATAAANVAASADASQAQVYNEAGLAASLPQVSVPAIGNLGSSNEGSTDTTSSNGTSATASDTGLLTQILSEFAGAINAPAYGATSNASLIPTLTVDPSSGLSGVPITVQAAQAGVAQNTLVPSIPSPIPVSAMPTSGGGVIYASPAHGGPVVSTGNLNQ